MLQYEDFESNILAITGSLFYKWRHLLPAIPLAHRQRFLLAINKGFRLPQAYDFVMTSQTIHDDEFEDFLRQAYLIQINDTNEPCVFADALLIAS
ncbi:MAG: hypothetical protein R2800_08205 [Flavipsychrobacter sp.]